MEPTPGVKIAQSGGGDLCVGATVACGACAQLCPQGIEIPEIMERLADAVAT